MATNAKKEKPPEYYDNLFETEKDYRVSYRQSYYYVHWTQVIRFLEYYKKPKILEIWCGTGQLAEYIYNEGFRNYTGFDISPKAIEIAKTKSPFKFFIGDARDSSCFDLDYDLVICLEVLEHIIGDKTVIRNIKQGTKIIFSVPNFTGAGHVRWFRTERSLKSRYYKLINIKKIIRIGDIYICLGIVDPFKPNVLQRFFKTREKTGISSFTKRIAFRLKNILKFH